MRRRTTILDVAKATGLSVCTVNRALTGKPHIVPETKAKVLEAAARLGYTPNAIARSMGRPPMRIAILYPDRWPSHFEALVDGVKKRLEDLSDYRIDAVFRKVASFSESRKFAHAVETIVEEDVKGVIFAPLAANREREEIFTRLAASGLPHVSLGCVREPFSKALCAVRHDSSVCGSLAASLLAFALPRSAKTAIFIGGRDVADHKLKLEAFVTGLARRGMPEPAVVEALDDPEKAFTSAEALFSRHHDIAGLYVGTENVSGVIEYLKTAGRVDAIKFVATGISKPVIDGLSDGMVNATIHQRQSLQGRMAVDALVKFLDSGEMPPCESLVTPQILFKENCGGALE